MNTRRTGKCAEELAARHLQKQGLTHLTSNYSCRYGEIDLIMREEATLVFIEVRYRSRHEYGGGAASVDHRKQRKLLRTATHYLQRTHQLDALARIDVVAINALDGRTQSIQWIKNAIET